jgi:hypothetical protein
MSDTRLLTALRAEAAERNGPCHSPFEVRPPPKSPLPWLQKRDQGGALRAPRADASTRPQPCEARSARVGPYSAIRRSARLTRHPTGAARCHLPRKVNACVHALFLRRPRRSHERPRKSAHVRALGCFDLGQVSAEVADDIRAPEVDGQSPEGALMLAPWARQAYDDALAVVSEELTRHVWHSRTVAGARAGSPATGAGLPRGS